MSNHANLGFPPVERELSGMRSRIHQPFDKLLPGKHLGQTLIFTSLPKVSDQPPTDQLQKSGMALMLLGLILTIPTRQKWAYGYTRRFMTFMTT